MKFEVIDFHTHPFFEEADNICYNKDIIPFNSNFTLELMDKLCISKFCGSVVSFNNLKEMHANKTEWETIIKQNQKALKLRDYYKGRYIPGFHIHPNYLDESIKEIDKMKELGVNLIGEIVPFLHGYSLKNNENLDEILDYAQKKDMLVSIHTMEHIYMDELIKKHKGLKIVMAHPGEHTDIFRHVERMKLSDNCYLDLSGNGITRFGMLNRLIKEVGSERLIYGSDYPICNPIPFLKGVIDDLFLTDTEKENILSKNAKRLLKLS